MPLWEVVGPSTVFQGIQEECRLPLHQILGRQSWYPAVACKLAPVLLSEVGEYLESADLVRYPQMRERALVEVQIS